MFKTGLVSVSFRSLSVDEIIALAREAGLEYIEWGTDVHATVGDRARLEYIRDAQAAAGVRTSSLGTYFCIGTDSTESLTEYIRAARLLCTDVLRIWCGKKGYMDMTEEERAYIRAEAKKAACIAQDEGVILCLECHNHTYTDSLEGALDIMKSTDSDSFLMYWQPNQFKSEDENLKYAAEISKYTKNIHVFNWSGKERYPLSLGASIWQSYLSVFRKDTMLLLEFMPDNDPRSLAREAESLRKICSDIGDKI